ncbi:otoraplin-like [Carcharodon carcharias]|uniref:otoraplin-like n=1 Tax=Carcharodon carcharias TaxID=13397 RepID=UPI001B7DFC52|nr:otoraplin-like [Carcharodon carcharias]
MQDRCLAAACEGNTSAARRNLIQATLKHIREKEKIANWEIRMAQFAGCLFPLLLLGLTQAAKADFMDKLAEKKVCADEECIYVISTGQVVDDYNAPDCRFLDLKEGQLVYVYSKLVREGQGGEFWSGSIYSDHQFEDQMGIVGYFPSTMITEQHVFQNTTVELPTTAIDFYCD